MNTPAIKNTKRALDRFSQAMNYEAGSHQSGTDKFSMKRSIADTEVPTPNDFDRGKLTDEMSLN